MSETTQLCSDCFHPMWAHYFNRCGWRTPMTWGSEGYRYSECHCRIRAGQRATTTRRTEP